MEGQMLSKLESGWHSAYEPNPNSFIQKKTMQVQQDREKKLELKHTMITLKALR